jgi:hypothetical protein
MTAAHEVENRRRRCGEPPTEGAYGPPARLSTGGRRRQRLDDDVARRVLNVANSSEVAELRRGCGWRGEGAVRLVCAAGPTRGELRRPGRSW